MASTSESRFAELYAAAPAAGEEEAARATFASVASDAARARQVRRLAALSARRLATASAAAAGTRAPRSDSADQELRRALKELARPVRGRGKPAKVAALQAQLVRAGLLKPGTSVPASRALSKRDGDALGENTIGRWLLRVAPSQRCGAALYSPESGADVRRLAAAITAAARSDAVPVVLRAQREKAVGKARTVVEHLGNLLERAEQRLSQKDARYVLDIPQHGSIRSGQLKLQLPHGGRVDGYLKLYAALLAEMEEIERLHQQLRHEEDHLHSASTDDDGAGSASDAAVMVQRALHHAQSHGSVIGRAGEAAEAAGDAARRIAQGSSVDEEEVSQAAAVPLFETETAPEGREGEIGAAASKM